MAEHLRVFHQLQVAHSALFRAADRRTRQAVGLSTSQIAVLFVLSQMDGQPISEIAKQLSMGKSGLTGLVDRMVDRSLVERRPSRKDGRVINIHLQPAGQEILAQAKRETGHFNAALLDPFSDSEQQVIHQFLNHLIHQADSIINPPQDVNEDQGDFDDTVGNT